MIRHERAPAPGLRARPSAIPGRSLHANQTGSSQGTCWGTPTHVPEHLPTHEPRLLCAAAPAYGLDKPATPGWLEQRAAAWRPYRTWGRVAASRALGRNHRRNPRAGHNSRRRPPSVRRAHVLRHVDTRLDRRQKRVLHSAQPHGSARRAELDVASARSTATSAVTDLSRRSTRTSSTTPSPHRRNAAVRR
jgi:hypothetical protein